MQLAHADVTEIKNKEIESNILTEKIWQDIDGEKKSIVGVISEFGLVVLSYTDCETLCPTIAVNTKGIVAALNKENIQTQNIFISINPETDTLAARKKHFLKFNLDSSNWHFFKADIKKAERIAQILQMSFGEHRNNEHIMHSSKVALLDKKGKVLNVFDFSDGSADQISQKMKLAIRQSQR